MSFGADNNVGVVDVHEYQKAFDVFWVEFHSTVDEGHEVAMRFFESIFERIAFALVFGVVKEADVFRSVLKGCFSFFGNISTAIGDEDDFVVLKVVLQFRFQYSYIPFNLFFVEKRNDDRNVAVMVDVVGLCLVHPIGEEY